MDPGSRIRIASMESKRFQFRRIMKKYVCSHTVDWKRNRKCNKLPHSVQEAVKKVRERQSFPISPKSKGYVVDYTVFPMKWFALRDAHQADETKTR